MLMLSLSSQLGNQMFQYAAVRTYAEQRGFRFSFRRRRYQKRRFPLLSTYFRLGGESSMARAAGQMGWWLRPIRGRQFSPRRELRGTTKPLEVYDPSWWQVEDWTHVQGGFTCEAYFARHQVRVLERFIPYDRYLKMLDRIEGRLGAPPERRCCVHVRRTDYANADKGLAFKDQGWMLPLAYYREAMARLPQGLSYVFISDDPEFVAGAFADLEPKYIARGNPAVVDMFLMTRCRYNIIANSSFSWWGAWCNQIPDKVVIGPKYHLGWTKQVWIPDGIGPVARWQYVDVRNALHRAGGESGEAGKEETLVAAWPRGSAT